MKSNDFLICARKHLNNPACQKKVQISKVFNINFKEMSILKNPFFICPTPCTLKLLYTAGAGPPCEISEPLIYCVIGQIYYSSHMKGQIWHARLSLEG